MLFRIEDENGFDAKLREYNKSGMDNATMYSSVADKYVAGEIRREVNGANDRNLFRCTRSLAVALFKYNDVGDNPLVLAEYIENTLWVETEEKEILPLPYDMCCDVDFDKEGIDPSGLFLAFTAKHLDFIKYHPLTGTARAVSCRGNQQ